MVQEVKPTKVHVNDFDFVACKASLCLPRSDRNVQGSEPLCRRRCFPFYVLVAPILVWELRCRAPARRLRAASLVTGSACLVSGNLCTLDSQVACFGHDAHEVLTQLPENFQTSNHTLSTQLLCRGLPEVHNCKWHQDQVRSVRAHLASIVVHATIPVAQRAVIESVTISMTCTCQVPSVFGPTGP